MSYSVQFVGLVCFYRERGGRLALLPDGRDPGPGIEPHDGSIVVDPAAIEEANGWGDGEDVQSGTFRLSPCEITIDGAADAGALNTEEHEGRLPQLRQIDPNFEIDPAKAKTIAKMRIRNGTLTAYLIPGSGTAVMSQLDVDHDGPIDVVVKPDDGSSLRTIRLKPGTEIAIANMGRGGYAAEERDDHFKIYEKLSVKPVSLTPPTTVADLPRSKSTQALFSKKKMGIGLYTSCSNTGCC